MPIMRARNKESRPLEQWGQLVACGREQNTSWRGLIILTLKVSFASYNCSVFWFWKLCVTQDCSYFMTVLPEWWNLHHRKQWSPSLRPAPDTPALYLISSGEWQTWFTIGKSGFIPLRGRSSWQTLMWYPSVLEAGFDDKPGRVKHRATDYETYF
jgi:hypothetical protein